MGSVVAKGSSCSYRLRRMTFLVTLVLAIVASTSARVLLFSILKETRLTCLAHRNPHELHRSRLPEGPLRHSGVVLVWQFAQSFCNWPAPFLRFRFFLAASRLCTSSARYRFRFSICRNSYCQLVLRVVFSSSKTLSSEARL